MNKFVYSFNEGSKDMRSLLGGKGANLCEMTKLGLPVPKGFIVTTEACTDYFNNNKKVSKIIKDEILEKLTYLENVTKKKINDAKKPLLLSVRSGAKNSMPGMMDTILNVGLNDRLAIEMTKETNNKKFVYDSYRRLIMMYADVVCNLDKKEFEKILDSYKREHNYQNDIELNGDDWFCITEKYKKLYKKLANKEFPQDIKEQLLNATAAVFNSWNNDRAIYYRKMNNISDSDGTAVNVQEMVYGNLNDSSATGVGFSRNPSTGENEIYGEFMINAQGEDLVSGVRTPLSFKEFKKKMPKLYDEFCTYAKKLERHYKDMQDMEFTIMDNKLYLLQTRNGKRTPKAAIRIAVDLYNEGLISKNDAILRVNEKDIEKNLHETFKTKELKEAKVITKGLPASPGAGSGHIYFTSEEAIKANKNNEDVILIRLETSPEDITGMNVSNAVVTIHGGRTSHAAVVARGMGKCCVCGCNEIEIDEKNRTMYVNKKKYKEGDLISVDGVTGNIYEGKIATEIPKFDKYYEEFMKMVYSVKKLKIRANAETLNDVSQSLKFGAEGIGLSRTEHMFFEDNKLYYFRKMIIATTKEERIDALNEIKKIQIKDFEKIMKKLNGLPITVRYLDPPLHEFLPKTANELKKLSKELKCNEKSLERRVSELKEFNPMMGLRGCRLLIKYPEIIEMQTESLITAAINIEKKGIKTNLEIMIPLINDVEEFIFIKNIINKLANKLFKENNYKIRYKIGTMIELPRACVKAADIAMEADFFSFGTNDLTQMSYGFSRDDSSKFINTYIENGILQCSPFESLDISGVGELINIAVMKAKCIKPNIKLGICGEHGGDPKSVMFCHYIGLNYVSASPYRIPVAALAAAKAQIFSQNFL